MATGTVFVSGREHDGHDGYWMVTPLAVGGPDQPALPVVLGWVADPASAPAPPEGSADLVGWLQPPEGTGAVDDDPSDDVLPQLRIADIVQHVDQDLYGAYAVAQHGVAGLPAADLAALPDAGRFTAVRNLFYAFEWWFFGAFAVLIWWRWLGEQLAVAERGAAAGGRGPAGYRDGVKDSSPPTGSWPSWSASCWPSARWSRSAEVPGAPRAAASSSSARTPASCGSSTAGSTSSTSS